MATAKTGATPRLKKILAGRGASIDAQGLRQPGGAGADGAREGSFLGSRVLLSRSAGRSVEVVVVGRRRAVPVRQAAGARTLHLLWPLSTVASKRSPPPTAGRSPDDVRCLQRPGRRVYVDGRSGSYAGIGVPHDDGCVGGLSRSGRGRQRKRSSKINSRIPSTALDALAGADGENKFSVRQAFAGKALPIDHMKHNSSRATAAVATTVRFPREVSRL